MTEIPIVDELSALRSEVAECRKILLEGKPDCADDTLPSLLHLAVGSFRTRLARLSADRLTQKQAWAIFGLGIKPERGTYSSEYSGNDYAKALLWLRRLSEQGEDKR